ncbi:acyltransferase family protein [Ornithinimicrobium sp. W1665]|uniref:acyltransferase family protein n=1 Tax=Ornithinimicrobium sp. W1665 TaxID=3416666 RepID=UPI003D6BD197
MTSPSPVRAATNHRPLRGDIEGLRAVAVGTVLLYHLHVPWVPGGFAGVDVFFVISGFLITSLLLREVMRTGTVSLSDFYARRARRLLPAASVVIVATLVAGWLVLPARTRPDLLADVGSTLYVVNWVLAARSVDYLAEDVDPSPLQHYWSLSVEEQFYVVWPLLILLAVLVAGRYRLRRGRVAFVLLAALGVTSLVWSVLRTGSEPATAYFVTTTRLWELAAGALLAFAVPRLRSLPRGLSEIGVLVGLGLILLGMVVFSTATPWPGSAALLPVVGSVLVIAAGVPGHPTLGNRLLSLPPMVWIGGLSYAIYLWHWPVVVLAEARWGELSPTTLAGLGLLSVLLAWATKHLVEDPIRFQRSLAAAPWRSLVAGGATMALICTAALVGLLTRPSLEGGTSAPGPAALVADPDAPAWELRDDPSSAFSSTGPLSPDPILATKDVPGYYADDCQIQEGDPEPREDCVYGQVGSTAEVVLWGDSKLGQYFTALEAIAQDEGWRLTTYLKSACAPTVAGAQEEECNEFGRTVVDRILARDVPPEAVIVSTGNTATEELEAGMLEGVTALRDAGVPVVVLQDNAAPTVPEDADYDTAYDCAVEHADDLRTCDFPPSEPRGSELLGRVADEAQLPVVDLNRWLCPPGNPCPVAIGGILAYRQGSHVTETYARALTPFLHRALVDVGVAAAEPSSIALEDVPPGPGS